MSSSSSNSSNNFPRFGIRVSYVTGGPFLDILRGRQIETKGKQTRYIRDAIIDITKKAQTSYCEMLIQQGLGEEFVCSGTTTPDAFVSHAHDLLFDDVLSSLSWHFRNEPKAYVWFDLFSINQHEPLDWTFDWLSTTFQSNVANINRTVMVMTPWNNPLPYTRSWCIFEAGCTVQVGGKFEMAMSKKDEMDFLRHIRENDVIRSINRLLATVGAEKSQCSLPRDRESILAIIRETVGFAKLDSIVFERYREWVIEVTRRALDDECFTATANDDDDKIDGHRTNRMLYYYALGDLYGGQGKHEEAVRYKIMALEASRKIHGNGDDHTQTLKVMNSLANSYQKQGLYSKAEELYSACLKRKISIHGNNHPETLRTMNNLANSCRRLGRSAEAEGLYRTCLESKMSTLGADHPETLKTMNGLAIALLDQSLYNQAEELFRSCLDKKRVALSPDHPETLQTTTFLANSLRCQGQYEEADQLYLTCLEKQKTILGGLDHQDSLRTLSGLATSLREQGLYGKAEDLFRICGNKRKIILGESHPETIETMYNLALVLLNLHDACTKHEYDNDNDDIDAKPQQEEEDHHEKEAIELLHWCLAKQTVILGGDHPFTRQTKLHLAERERLCQSNPTTRT